MYDLFMQNTYNSEQKVYQLFMLGFDCDNLDDENSNLAIALKKGLGGIILFTRNIKTIDQTKKLNEQASELAIIPPLLSIDEEGGRVERTENIFGGKKFLSARYAAQKGEEFLINQTIEIANLLKSMGFNLNYAPCVDVNTNPENPIIGERAFSDNVDEVIKYGKLVNKTYLKHGILTCTKHFPGHGDAQADSHKTLPEIDLPIEVMKNVHIKPFACVQSPMMMVAHLHCSAFDDKVIPSSLSKNVIDYARNVMKYDGVLISDDMIMGAISGAQNVSIHAGINEVVYNPDKMLNSAVAALKAGVNMLMYRCSSNEIINLIENIIEIAKSDKELLRSIETSYNRVKALKDMHFGL